MAIYPHKGVMHQKAITLKNFQRSYTSVDSEQHNDGINLNGSKFINKVYNIFRNQQQPDGAACK